MSPTQELTVLPPTGAVALPETYQYDQTGLSDVAALKPTNLTLLQNTSREMRGGRPGQILDQLTEKCYDSLTVVPLRVMKNRVLFPPGSDLDSEPLCRSNDCIVPSKFVEHPQAANCKGCPHSMWLDGKPSPCKEKRKLLVIVKDTGLPRYITFGGRSLTSLQWLLDNIAQDIHINKLKGLKLNLFDYSFAISGDSEKSKKGSYYVARFSDIKRVATPGEFGPLFTQFVLDRQHQVEEEEQAATAKQNETNVNSAVSQVLEAELVSV
jgi:hypothetical protein